MGIALVFALTILLTLFGQGRSLIVSMPFIVAFTVKELDRFSLQWGDVGIFLCLSLWFSKIWMHQGLLKAIPRDPNLYFYAHVGGYWMDTNFYFFHLGSALMCAWILWTRFKFRFSELDNAPNLLSEN